MASPLLDVAGVTLQYKTARHLVTATYKVDFAVHDQYWPLAGRHATATCASCHVGEVYAGTPTACDGCHHPAYVATTAPAHGAAGFPTTCQTCHGVSAWAPSSFDHEATWPIRGAHTMASCASCHGGGVYAGTPRVCQGCHLADYQAATNPSHVALVMPTTCVSCHTAHTIRPPSEPKSTVHPTQVAHTCGRCHSDAALMAKYRLPADIVAKWERSVHGVPLAEGRDLSVPTCNDCHGDHGATPPEAASVAGVCGHCHAHNRELFEASAKLAIFADLGEQGCVTCHGNHGVVKPGDEFVGLGEGAVCADCHGNVRTEAVRFRTARSACARCGRSVHRAHPFDMPCQGSHSAHAPRVSSMLEAVGRHSDGWAQASVSADACLQTDLTLRRGYHRRMR